MSHRTFRSENGDKIVISDDGTLVEARDRHGHRIDADRAYEQWAAEHDTRNLEKYGVLVEVQRGLLRALRGSTTRVSQLIAPQLTAPGRKVLAREIHRLEQDVVRITCAAADDVHLLVSAPCERCGHVYEASAADDSLPPAPMAAP